jgi:CRP-like cAMP-binding protein
MAKRSSPRKKAGSTRSSTRPPPANLLLAALPAVDYDRLVERLEIVPFRLKQFVHRSGEPLTHVHFPGGGFFSELTVLATGDMVEVATIGREGMAGWTAGMDRAAVPSVTMVQAEMDTCYQLSVADFAREMALGGAFRKLINRYRQALMGVIMQSTACNVVHSLEQRLARWFLMAHDRMARDEFPLTQEFVAMMLGAARPTVSTVAGALQKSGVITYRRGRVRVLDRPGLEAASCECYAVSASLLRRVTEGA